MRSRTTSVVLSLILVLTGCDQPSARHDPDGVGMDVITDSVDDLDQNPLLPPDPCAPISVTPVSIPADVVCLDDARCQVEIPARLDEATDAVVTVEPDEYLTSLPAHEIRFYQSESGELVESGEWGTYHIPTGRYDVVVNLDGDTCGTGIEGQLVVADDVLIDGTRMLAATMSDEQLNAVTFEPDFGAGDQSERWRRATWAVLLTRSGQIPSQREPGERWNVAAVVRGDQRQTVQVIDGVYDIWVGRISPYMLPTPPCGEVDGMGIKRVLSNVRIDADQSIPMRLRPQHLQLSPTEPFPFEDLNVGFRNDEIPGLSRLGISLSGDIAELDLWPGSYTMETIVGFGMSATAFRASASRDILPEPTGEQTVMVDVQLQQVMGHLSYGAGLDPDREPIQAQVGFLARDAVFSNPEVSHNLGDDAEIEVPMVAGDWVVAVDFSGSDSLSPGRHFVGPIALDRDVDLGEIELGRPVQGAFQVADPPPSPWGYRHGLRMTSASTVQGSEWPQESFGVRLLPGHYAIDWVLRADDEPVTSVAEPLGWRLTGCEDFTETGFIAHRLDTNWQELELAIESPSARDMTIEIRFLGNRKGTQHPWSRPLITQSPSFRDVEELTVPLFPGFYEITVTQAGSVYQPVVVEFRD